MALAKNTRTGKVVSVPAHYIGHSVLGKNLVAYGEKVSAAPKEKNKPAKEATEAKAPESKPVAKNSIFSKSSFGAEIEGQPAPETNIEDEENEHGN